MADFDKAFAYLSPMEGGYVDDPADRGGATRFGISLRFYKENVDKYATEEDIQSLNLASAKQLYYTFFWHQLGLSRLDSQPVANRVFALAVHAGLRPAVRVLQRALNSSGRFELALDGILGEQTLRAAGELLGKESERILLADLRLKTLEFYRRILARRPALEKFRRGWERRGVA